MGIKKMYEEISHKMRRCYYCKVGHGHNLSKAGIHKRFRRISKQNILKDNNNA